MALGDIQNYTAASSAAVAQTAYMIGIDHAIHKSPEHTYFRERWVTFAPFSFETLSHPVQNAGYGRTGTVALGKLSDLVYKVFLRYHRHAIEAKDDPSQPSSQFPFPADCTPCAAEDRAYFSSLAGGDLSAGIDEYVTRHGGVASGRAALPIEGDAAADDGEPAEVWAHYTNSYATAAASSVTAMVGHAPLDTLSRTAIFVWSELCVTASQRVGYNEMVGRAYSRADLIKASKQEQMLYQELPFWHTSTPAKALGIICGLYSPVEYHIQFARLQEMVVRSGPNVRVVKAGTSSELTDNDLRVWLDAVHIYLEQAERDRFGLSPYDLIVSMHKQYVFPTTGKRQVACPVQIAHAFTDVNFVVQRECNVKANDHFALGGQLGVDPIDSAEITFAGTVRMQRREAQFWRLVANRAYPSQPEQPVYSALFCLDPCSSKPNGNAGGARFDGFTLNLWLAPGLERESLLVHVLVKYQNILKMRNGVIGPAFG